MRRQDGAIALHILGGVLMALLLVGGLGLAETARALTLKTQATRALAAAVQSAAQADEADREQVFRQVLAANLDAAAGSYRATLHLLAPGSVDPVTGARLERPAVSGQLDLTFRLNYLTSWRSEVPLRLQHTTLAKRKPSTSPRTPSL